jgi:hypothetical protein
MGLSGITPLLGTQSLLITRPFRTGTSFFGRRGSRQAQRCWRPPWQRRVCSREILILLKLIFPSQSSMETLPDRPGSYSFFHDVGNLLNEEYYTEDELYVGNEVEKRPPPFAWRIDTRRHPHSAVNRQTSPSTSCPKEVPRPQRRHLRVEGHVETLPLMVC